MYCNNTGPKTQLSKQPIYSLVSFELASQSTILIKRSWKCEAIRIIQDAAVIRQLLS